MIAINSKSYPYLAIAQHYNVSYREVLILSDRLDDIAETGKRPLLFYDWERKVLERWKEINDGK